jgi:hypothetical protein
MTKPVHVPLSRTQPARRVLVPAPRVLLASLTGMEGEQGAAPAAAPRVQVVRHPQFSDSIQPPGGWVNDPADVRQTQSADADDDADDFCFDARPAVPAPAAAIDLEPPAPTRVEEVATTRNQQPGQPRRRSASKNRISGEA